MEVSSVPIPGETRSRSEVASTPARSSLIGALSSVAFLGDTIAIILGLLFAFWLRFESGWITFGVQAFPMPRLVEYLPLFGVGTVFLLGILTYVNLYDSRNLLRFRRVGLLVAKGTAA